MHLTTLLFIYFVPLILSHPARMHHVGTRQGPVLSCGYMTTEPDDNGEALTMIEDNACHTFSEEVPDLVDKLQYFWLNRGCACLWWTVDGCPGFPNFFATGPINQNFPAEENGRIRAYGCYADQSSATGRTANTTSASRKGN